MNAHRVVVFGEGRHELGSVLNKDLHEDSLPALPKLVRRLLDCPRGTTYACRSFAGVAPVHTRGHKFAIKAQQAIRLAKREGYQAAAILIDRDRQPDKKRVVPLRQGRDGMGGGTFPPCAVGQAVEAFDAWMIVDGNAAKAAGGDPEKARPNPESLDGKEGTGRHPKDGAAAVFGSKRGLAGKYAVVARQADLGLLQKSCPKGFGPFAAEVRERIGPVVSS